ncbi:MAG: phage holin family protein [Marinospirillum sp.]|uniref:phage holin family protein n=1 Tax=Marinospirillum sp. TaxID=2183934 RepID=UPI001A0E0393|nr:phage holin family protein [Marinospirillum sp.]MBE0505883.1 phage holin family protein [Marinospirillum sp.]
MPEKEPQNYTWIQYAWVIGIAIWGGAVKYLQRLRVSGESVSAARLLEEFLTSALAGVLMFYACELAGMDGLTSAIAIAIAGHMGGELFDEIKAWARKRYMRNNMPPTKTSRAKED